MSEKYIKVSRDKEVPSFSVDSSKDWEERSMSGVDYGHESSSPHS